MIELIDLLKIGGVVGFIIFLVKFGGLAILLNFANPLLIAVVVIFLLIMYTRKK